LVRLITETPTYTEETILTNHGPRCGVQKSWTWKYTCLVCNYEEERDTPIRLDEVWQCKRCTS